ncbi:MAG: response regulator [Bacteroidota bacterium]|nr:response regulator [Bacteroidota bacterium]
MIKRKPRHIFIVEDSEVYSMMLDYILSKDSVYNFESFRSGEECLKNIHRNPAIVILDHGLPGIDGYETLLQIKKHDPSIHVVMLTSNQDKVLEANIIKAGADDFVLKQGHGENQIIEKIEDIIDRDMRIAKARKKSRIKKMAYCIIIAIIVAFGFS